MACEFHKDGTLPSTDKEIIFVYGANEAGIHGAGSAKVAYQYYGAKYYEYGFNGHSYGIPTKCDNVISTLAKSFVELHVSYFLQFVRKNPDRKFFIVRVGCGLAGYKDKDMAPMFSELKHNENISFPQEWQLIL